MDIALIIIEILWITSAILVVPNITPYINDLSLWKQAIMAIIIMIGAPFMLVTQAIELLLDIFLEEGWNDDDDNKFGS